jgi:hypothetical protein
LCQVKLFFSNFLYFLYEISGTRFGENVRIAVHIWGWKFATSFISIYLRICYMVFSFRNSFLAVIKNCFVVKVRNDWVGHLQKTKIFFVNGSWIGCVSFVIKVRNWIKPHNWIVLMDLSSWYSSNDDTSQTKANTIGRTKTFETLRQL